MKCHVIFSLKNNKKECHLLQFYFSALRVRNIVKIHTLIIVQNFQTLTFVRKRQTCKQYRPKSKSDQGPYYLHSTKRFVKEKMCNRYGAEYEKNT